MYYDIKRKYYDMKQVSLIINIFKVTEKGIIALTVGAILKCLSFR